MNDTSPLAPEGLCATLLALLEAWPLAVVGFDPAGKIIVWNQAAQRIFGWTAEETLGRTNAQLQGQSSRAAHRYLQRIMAGEALAKQEVRQRTKNGQTIDVSWSAAPLEDLHGKSAGTLVLMENITARKQLEWALLESERFSRDVVDALPQQIAILDERGVIIAVNKAWRDFAETNVGHTEKPREGDNYLEVCDRAKARGSQVAEAYAEGIRAVMNGALIEFSLEFPSHSSDLQSWFNGRVSRFSEKGPTRIVITHENITELKLAEKAIQKLAQYDPLTNLPNRMLLLDRLGQELEKARRERLHAAILFLDLDRFKLINDSLGHAAGDKLLKIVADRLTECVRKSDTVARLGGDEFIIVLPIASQVEDITLIAQKVLHSLTLPVELEGQTVFTSTSIGIALFPEDGKDVDSLIRCADMAMYRAKDMGRNTYQFFSAEMNQKMLRRVSMEQALRQALQRDELQLYYQEQTDLLAGKIIGFEVLLRWRHPQLGLLAPAEFLGLAEETGLILPIGEWVLRTACAQNRAWQEAGLPPLRVAVNLSGRQLRQVRLSETIARILDETRLSPQWLEVELTENHLSGDLETCMDRLQQLKRIGISVAVDDFGTGFSSLRNLKRLPIDRLKIDHSFLAGSDLTPDSSAIVRTIIVMAHSLGLKVIAEGVETNQQRDFLREHGCDEVQGYYFSRPVPKEEFRKILFNSRQSS